ncbi:hypothetical protein MLD38_006796 [Melastoma candidum]|uniref:Uncharacterized protein n=1 Tax=Melastoma candidum TaxID=119954 RepID=A0ACB9RQ95_9MYRT|nr:hypothetical protein MLD38_006796 [Melastoma candidum]
MEGKKESRKVELRDDHVRLTFETGRVELKGIPAVAAYRQQATKRKITARTKDDGREGTMGQVRGMGSLPLVAVVGGDGGEFMRMKVHRLSLFSLESFCLRFGSRIFFLF